MLRSKIPIQGFEPALFYQCRVMEDKKREKESNMSERKHETRGQPLDREGSFTMWGIQWTCKALWTESYGFRDRGVQPRGITLDPTLGVP
jgi:hypothetical protein